MLMMPPWPIFRTCTSRVSNVHDMPINKDKLDATVILCSGGDCCDDLTTAIVSGSNEKIDFLIEQNGCDVNRITVCQPGELCISPACVRRSKLPSDIHTQRSFQSLPSDSQPSCGYTLLQIAIQAGQVASVDALLHAGANPSLRRRTSPSCLCMALAQGDEMTYRLLKYGVDIDDDAVKAVAALGSLPLFSAMSRRLSTAQLVKAMSVAASHQHLHIVQHLLDTGDDVVIQKGLHAMVQQGCLALVRHVVKSYGPSVVLYCEPNKLGDSLLHTACRANQPELIKYLIRCGVDVNALNAIGVSPLYICAAFGAELSVRMLLKGGAQTHRALGPRGDTALHVAVQENHLQIVRLLVHHHIPLETKNELGNTALHLASMHGHNTIAQYLLRKGSNIHAANTNNETPLAKACQMNHRHMIEILIENGAISPTDKLTCYKMIQNGKKLN